MSIKVLNYKDADALVGNDFGIASNCKIDAVKGFRVLRAILRSAHYLHEEKIRVTESCEVAFWM